MERRTPGRRPSVVFEESKWTEYFNEYQPFPCSHQPKGRIEDRRDELVRKVSHMIQECISKKENLFEVMKIVDVLERLGVGYHFEEDIATFLDILNRNPSVADDLYAASLQFRLLRQHHYDAPCEIFKDFMDENGDFKDTLRSNVDALLSLYEAAHLRKRDEDILKRAIVFTTNSLSSLANGGDHLPKPIRDEVLHALASPTHRRIKRLEAKSFISIYEDDKESNEDILELAKLDFHILLQMHRDEVKSLSLWYKDLNARCMLGRYIRERPVENYYWALCVCHEPHYAKPRMMFAKIMVLLSFFDDTFDSYGTLEEVHQFNQAVQSWDEGAAKQIGNYYAYVMSIISKTLDEFIADDGASQVGINCFKETMKDVSKCMLQEVVWREEVQVPTVDDYLKKAAVISVMYLPVAVILFLGMNAVDEHFTWANSLPKIIEIGAIMCRLMDDIAGHENEKEERSKCFTAVDCYVKHHGVMVKEAKQVLSCIVEEDWWKINEEFLSNDKVPVPMLMVLLNLVRTMGGIYNDVDTYTKCSKVADPIHKLLNECVNH
ncbi:hypothetical protein HU200_008676 [Digitaria exilis]|uniref:Uncharacterized protein n=1 Tax=Digitaria exilis TaxID=1010633 RepID=A0A835FMZ5_9POAL|nr:hypothetical protein HU200_008676 [Digitaria exilis]